MSDPVLAATDVASTVYDEQAANVNVNVIGTPVSDQMFDMIIGGTPETSFINDYMEKHRKVESLKSDVPSLCETKEASDDKNSCEEKEKGKNSQNESILVAEERESKNYRKSDDVSDIGILLASQNNKLENSFTSTVSSRGYKRDWNEDSLSHSMIEGNPEYDNLFSDFESVGPFASLPGLAEGDNPSSPAISTPSVEISNEVRQRQVRLK